MGGRITRHLTYANVVATLALFVALGGTAAAAVIVSSNGQVAKNTIAGHNPPSGAHANIIAGSVNGSDLSSDLTASLTVHCPAGLQPGIDICFDKNPRPGAPFTSALKTCALAGMRLPSVAEMAEIFNETGAPQNYEWFDVPYYVNSQLDEGQIEQTASRDLVISYTYDGRSDSYRCVRTPTN